MNEFIETWKRIADAVNRSERWCRYTSMRQDDPLPIYKVGGIVRLDVADFNAWLERERERSIARPVAILL